MRKEKGFSLIELLIVVAIILILAGIVGPNLLKSRMAANEASAAASERTIATAEVTFSSTYNNGFSTSLVALGPRAAGTAASSTAADLIDSTLAGATASTAVKGGYFFVYTTGATSPTTSFSLVGIPANSGSTGTSTFCIDQTTAIKKDPQGSVTTATSSGCPASATPGFRPM